MRVYLDDALLGEALADVRAAGGTCRPIRGAFRSPGDHTLRADQVAEDGKVVARVEVPFEPMAMLTSTGSMDTEQDGRHHHRARPQPLADSRRTAMERGYDYTVIYEANRDQIKDPDLIYPGQVLTLPAATN